MTLDLLLPGTRYEDALKKAKHLAEEHKQTVAFDFNGRTVFVDRYSDLDRLTNIFYHFRVAVIRDDVMKNFFGPWENHVSLSLQ